LLLICTRPLLRSSAETQVLVDGAGDSCQDDVADLDAVRVDRRHGQHVAAADQRHVYRRRGPNGVGKTTAATLLATRLRERQELPVHLTTEPSNTPLGRLLRSSRAVLTGRALALAIAADRYAHLDSEVVPMLDSGHHVVSDRYLQSSLVLQRVDGLPIEEIWRYNA
jgi:hypothetical protein